MTNTEKIKLLIKSSMSYRDGSFFHKGEIEAKSQLEMEEVNSVLKELQSQGVIRIKDGLNPVIDVLIRL